MHDVHGCSECGEVQSGYHIDDRGYRRCVLCGGVVLDLQESFDKILDLRAELSLLREELGMSSERMDNE